jgi:hypothetical protein
MKKVGIISPISRIVIDGQSIRSLEAIFLKKYLDKENIVKCHYISKKIKETNEDYIDIFNLKDLNEYEVIFIHNFNMNFFGGLVPSLTTQFLKLIAGYNGRIYYYITDPKLKYNNIAEQLLKRDNLKYESFIDNNELLNIKNKLNSIELRMNALFTGYNYSNIYGLDFYNIKYYNVFKDIAINFKDEKSLFDEEIIKEYDICYYGDNRGTYRNNKIKKYFNNNYIKSLLIGCDLDIKYNTHIKKVNHDELKNLVKKSYASLVIGDKEHENAFITMRFYENIKYEVVSFIDIDYDINKKLFTNDFLRDFNYISSENDLNYKIKKIKNDKELYNKIIYLQNQELINK